MFAAGGLVEEFHLAHLVGIAAERIGFVGHGPSFRL
jgi:hypothetical protein